MTDIDTLIQNIKQEVRRGTLDLAVLTQTDEPRYAYSLIQTLGKQGIKVDQNTLYPLLRRIEDQGLLRSVWKVEANRPRRYYMITEFGIETRAMLIKDWSEFEKIMSGITRMYINDQ